MRIEFTKMHGCGNDYIFIECRDGVCFDPVALAVRMSPRHMAVGADGIVLICGSIIADAGMRMFNADGSEGAMCGNALRCIGKYLYDTENVKRTELTIETKCGVRELALNIVGGEVKDVTVDMGTASFSVPNIPMESAKDEFVNEELRVEGETYRVTCVSMGNPHAVMFVPSVKELDIERLGPKIERHPLFPDRINVEFVEPVEENELVMRVWERGSGETYSCGSGACAAAAAAIRLGICKFDSPVKMHLLGGDLTVLVKRNFDVLLTGGAETVYEGVYYL